MSAHHLYLPLRDKDHGLKILGTLFTMNLPWGTAAAGVEWTVPDIVSWVGGHPNALGGYCVTFFRHSDENVRFYVENLKMVRFTKAYALANSLRHAVSYAKGSR